MELEDSNQLSFHLMQDSFPTFLFRDFGRFNCLPFGHNLIDVDSKLSSKSLLERNIQIFNVTDFCLINAREPSAAVNDMKS